MNYSDSPVQFLPLIAEGMSLLMASNTHMCAHTSIPPLDAQFRLVPQALQLLDCRPVGPYDLWSYLRLLDLRPLVLPITSFLGKYNNFQINVQGLLYHCIFLCLFC